MFVPSSRFYFSFFLALLLHLFLFFLAQHFFSFKKDLGVFSETVFISLSKEAGVSLEKIDFAGGTLGVPSFSEKKVPLLTDKNKIKVKEQTWVSKSHQEKTSKQESNQGVPPEKNQGSSGVSVQGTGEGKGQQGGGGASVLNEIRRKILRAKYYPSMAKEKGQEGVVKVLFQIQSNGSVGSLKLVSSSGFSLLDDAALSTIKKAAPYPYYADPIVMPLRYELKK